MRMAERKVAYFVGTLQTGGIERSVTDWCLHLKNHTSWQPVVVCLSRKSGPFQEVLEGAGIEVHECRLSQPRFVKRLIRLLSQINPTVVHSQVAFSMPWQVLGAKLARVPKLVFTQQNEYQNWNPLLAKVRIRTYFLLFRRYIDHYTCVSEKVRESLSRLVGERPERFLVIPNGVNTELFLPRPEIRSAERAALGVNETTFVVGMVARFSPQKGHQYLVEGVDLLRTKRKDFVVVLVGTGELQDTIAKLIVDKNLSNYIKIAGRSLQVERLAQAMDCFILSSLWEGMPLALLEAMACGIPVIGTDVAGTREVIRNEENGLLIASADPAAIAKGLERVLDDKALRTRLSQAGRASVERSYSVASNMEKYIALYEG